MDFIGSTGVEKITVQNSTAATGTIDNIGTADLVIKNQKTAVTFDKSTATALNLTFDTVGTAVGTTITPITVDLGKTAGNKATSFNITAKDAYVTLSESAAGAATTSATIAATGKNQLTFAANDALSLTSVSVTGSGSVDLSKATLSAAKTLKVADGGVSAIINNQTAADVTIVTGAGVDTLSVSGAGLKSATTGAGNDVVTVGNAAQAVLAGNGATGLGGGTVTGAGDEAAAILAVQALTAAALAAGTITLAQKTDIDTAADTATDTAAATAAAAAAAQTIATAGGVVSATATIDLGAGDDTLTLGSAFAAGATLTAGDGTDTLAMAKGNYATVAGGGAYTTTNLAKITGFEVLSITDALGDTDTIDVSKIAGITSFKAAAGIATAATTATVSNLGANSTLELAGLAANDGTLVANLKTDTAADTMTLKLNKDYTDNNDTTIDARAASHTVVAAAVETLNVVSTGNMTNTFTPVAGYKADLVKNTLDLTGSNALTDVVVSGNHALSFASTKDMTKLATIDGSSNTGGITFNGSLADMTTPTTSVAMTIKGSLTAANTLTGTGHADTIIGGSAADTIKGGLSGDTLTGNGGNDTFVFGAGDSVIGTGTVDKITDFVANTLGNGTNGAADKTGAIIDGRTDATKLNGDVLSIKANGTGAKIIETYVASNASDATTFLANNSGKDSVYAALDSSTGKLYIDNAGTGSVSDGVADLVIELSGVTTIDEAAFIIA